MVMSALVTKSHEENIFPKPKESRRERSQRELNELKNRLRNYQEHLNHAEEMYEETKEEIERIQTKAEHQRELVKNESAREARMMAKLTEMNEEFDKVKGENKTAVRQVILDKSGKVAARHTTAYRVMRFVKIGCVLLLDSVAAYTLYHFTKPLLFFLKCTLQTALDRVNSQEV